MRNNTPGQDIVCIAEVASAIVKVGTPWPVIAYIQSAIQTSNGQGLQHIGYRTNRPSILMLVGGRAVGVFPQMEEGDPARARRVRAQPRSTMNKKWWRGRFRASRRAFLSFTSQKSAIIGLYLVYSAYMYIIGREGDLF